eukprot:75389-Amphidinium_carterae.1
MVLPHVAVEELSEKHLGSMTKSLVEASEKGDLPDSYLEHPVVQKCLDDGEPLPLPLSLFVDGVNYGNKQGMTVVTLSDIHSGPKLLLAAVRDKVKCRCGCRSWCTMFEVFRVLSWSIGCLMKGKHPVTDHLGQAFAAGSALAEKEGQELRRRCIITQ